MALVNNRDRIVGFMSHPWEQYPAWVSPDAPPVQITQVPGLVDINDAGRALIGCSGKTTTTGPYCEPEVAGIPGSSIRSIGYPRGTWAPAWATALNERDQVAGTYLWTNNSRGVRRRPFLWENGTSYDVELDGDWEVGGVTDLNDGGVILAYGKNPRTGRQGALLLVPKS